jgi:hypothetical protein
MRGSEKLRSSDGGVFESCRSDERVTALGTTLKIFQVLVVIWFLYKIGVPRPGISADAAEITFSSMVFNFAKSFSTDLDLPQTLDLTYPAGGTA